MAHPQSVSSIIKTSRQHRWRSSPKHRFQHSPRLFGFSGWWGAAKGAVHEPGGVALPAEGSR
jgi:hypothetical protein